MFLPFLFGAVLTLPRVCGQDGQYHFVDVKVSRGTHLYTGEYLQEELRGGYKAMEFRFGWQTDGRNAWEEYYSYPSYGFGCYMGFPGSPDLVGNPGAIFGFLGLPFGNGRRNVFQSEVALGLGYSKVIYDPLHNPLNDIMGAHFGIYINLNLGGKFKLNERVDLLYGGGITHISNGRITQPNRGFNMVGLDLGLRYNFTTGKNYKNAEGKLQVRPDYDFQGKEQPQFQRKQLLVYYGAGLSQNFEDAGTAVRYFNSSGVVEYQFFFNMKHGITAGLDLFWDGSELPRTGKPWMSGWHVGYDYHFWKIMLRGQIGSYFNASESKGFFFMRPAVRFDVSRHLYTQLGLKTNNGTVADWFELGLGVNLL